MLLSRRIDNLQWKETAHSFARSLICSLVMAVVAWLAAHCAAPICADSLHPKIAQIVTVAFAIAAGIATYFLLALALRAPELREIKSALRGK